MAAVGEDDGEGERTERPGLGSSVERKEMTARRLLDVSLGAGEVGGHRIDEVAAMVAAGGFCNGRGRAG